MKLHKVHLAKIGSDIQISVIISHIREWYEIIGNEIFCNIVNEGRYKELSRDISLSNH